MTMPDGRPDAGVAAQRAAEAHLDACNAVNDEYEETGDLAVLERSPAVGPFCACMTCEIREVLAAAWPIVVADCADLIERAALPVDVETGARKRFVGLLRAEAERMALPHTPTHDEGVHA